MELKENDLKLLTYIYHNTRESYSKISKETKLSRTQVEYKINKFIEEGLIKKFFTLFNYGALGYNNYVSLLVKFEKFSTINNFTKKLDNSKNCISWGECFGKYDIYINLIFKTETEINDYISELLNSKSSKVSDYLLIKPYLAEFHNIKIFENNKKILPFTFPNEKEIKLDKDDIEILKMLEKDARTKVVDIAKKLDISGELALYKLKKLYNENIIIGSRAFLNMKILGYNYSGFFIHIKNLSKERRQELIKFAREHKLVNALLLSIMKPNCFIQVFHKTDEELKQTIRQVKEFLKNEPFELEVSLMNEENKINTLPFLTKI